MKNIFISFLTTLFLLGCTNNTNFEYKNSDNVIKLSEIDEVKFSDFFDLHNLEIINLGKNDSVTLSSDVQARIVDSLLFIYDKMTAQLYKFNKNGKLINKIGNPGNGPKEYLNIICFKINNNRIEVLTDKGNKIKEYDFEGNYISSFNLPVSCIDFYKLNDNLYWIYTGFYDEYRIHLCDSLKIVKSIFRNENKLLEFSEEKFFYNERLNQGLYKESLIPSVYKIDSTTITPLYKFILERLSYEKELRKLKTPDEFMDFLNSHEVWSIGQAYMGEMFDYFKIIKSFKDNVDITDVVIDKKNNTINKIKYQSSSIKTLSEYLRLIAIEGDRFYFITEPYYVKDLIKNFENKKIEPDEDNPVIILFKRNKSFFNENKKVS